MHRDIIILCDAGQETSKPTDSEGRHDFVPAFSVQCISIAKQLIAHIRQYIYVIILHYVLI
jgi:hypothetical protein